VLVVWRAMSSLGRLLRAAAIDTGPLRRHRDFRLLYVGQSVSLMGSMITYVAIPFQVYDLTGSTLAVGLLGLAELLPLLVTALIGGALADAHDRRNLVIIADTALLGLALVLVGNALLDEPRVWVLFVVAAGMSAAGGLQRPPLDAMLPRLVPHEDLAAASALDGFLGNVAQIAGPALGGVLLASAGVAATYAVDAATFLVSLAALAFMRPVPPPADAAPPTLARIREGWRYARSRQELIGTYAVDINAMLFGIPVALFPAVADRYGGPEVLGLLYAAEPVGAVAFTLTSGWVARVHRHGKAVAVSAGAYGAAIVAFGLADALPLALMALAAAGAADMSSGIFRQTLWNQTIPDHMRGRLAGIEQLSYSIGPTLGTARGGALAALTTVRFSIVSGGVACVAGTLVLAALMPRFWRYDAERTAKPVSA
jgi:MFS family permease